MNNSEQSNSETTTSQNPTSALDQYNKSYKISVVEQHHDQVGQVVKKAAETKATEFAGILTKGLAKLETLHQEFKDIKPDVEEMKSATGEILQAASYKGATFKKREQALKNLSELNKLVDTCMNIKSDQPYSDLEAAYNKLAKKVK